MSQYYSLFMGMVFSPEDCRLVITKEKERKIYSNHVKETSVNIN